MLTITEDAREKFFSLARSRGDLARMKYSSASGADKIDAVLHDLEARAFRRLGQGEPLELILDDLGKDWRAFAAEKNEEVRTAPKLRGGPMSGCSVIHYKHADPGKAASSLIFIRNMHKLIFDQDS